MVHDIYIYAVEQATNTESPKHCILARGEVFAQGVVTGD